MSNDPDQIREQIEITRGTLSSDVDTLAETVRPGNVARRQLDRVRGAAGGTRDKIMGTAADLGSTGGSAASDAAASSREAVRTTPDRVKAKTEGNPLAAGMIAFGVGWLAASLTPATRPERQAATKAKEHASTVTEPAGDVAKQVGSNLRASAGQAVDAVKSTGADAADTVRSEARSTVEDVKDQGAQATQAVRDTRS
jgi:hypothetical protein